MIADPISDLLTRIRNGFMARKGFILAPLSRTNLAVVEILKEQGYLTDVIETTSSRGRKSPIKQLKIVLKYVDGRPIVSRLERVSKPGQRIYLPVKRLGSVLRGTGVAVVSTSKGLMTDRQARETGVGGEVLFKVW